jgi:hypothetical protein
MSYSMALMSFNHRDRCFSETKGSTGSGETNGTHSLWRSPTPASMTTK